jgi:hypothetical protein
MEIARGAWLKSTNHLMLMTITILNIFLAGFELLRKQAKEKYPIWISMSSNLMKMMIQLPQLEERDGTSAVS